MNKLIHLSTDDGKTWSDVAPKDLPAWSTVSIIEPSHFEAGIFASMESSLILQE